MLEKIDGIILDVDGTLWDSTGIVAGAWTRAVRENGFPKLTVTADMLKRLFGKTMENIAAELLPQADLSTRTKVMEDCYIYEDEALARDPCRICYPGVRETMRELSARIPLFIVSNCQSGYIELFLQKTDLGDCVKDFACFGDTRKEKDETMRMVAKRNKLLSPAYVGDTQGDCNSARKAGIPFVFAAYGFGEADSYDLRISCFAELKSLPMALSEEEN